MDCFEVEFFLPLGVINFFFYRFSYRVQDYPFTKVENIHDRGYYIFYGVGLFSARMNCRVNFNILRRLFFTLGSLWEVQVISVPTV